MGHHVKRGREARTDRVSENAVVTPSLSPASRTLSDRAATPRSHCCGQVYTHQQSGTPMRKSRSQSLDSGTPAGVIQAADQHAIRDIRHSYRHGALSEIRRTPSTTREIYPAQAPDRAAWCIASGRPHRTVSPKSFALDIIQPNVISDSAVVPGKSSGSPPPTSLWAPVNQTCSSV